MSTPVWKDATSYSRGDRERVPSAWEIVSGALRVVVVSRHRLVPGQWVMHCDELRMDTVSLGVCSSQPAERAQADPRRDRAAGPRHPSRQPGGPGRC